MIDGQSSGDFRAETAGSVLAVMAHPDDAELWAGGTIAIHAATAEVTILVATTDEARRTEAAAGAELLGAKLKLVEQHSAETCLELLLALRPEIVITHRLDDFHCDHRRTAEHLIAALPKAVIISGYPKRLYSCDTYESMTISGHVPGQTIVDITDTFDIKMGALLAHRSRPLSDLTGMAKRLGASWGGRIGRPWAEAFDPIPILGRLTGINHL